MRTFIDGWLKLTTTNVNEDSGNYFLRVNLNSFINQTLIREYQPRCFMGTDNGK